jgi:hypothetical protein
MILEYKKPLKNKTTKYSVEKQKIVDNKTSAIFSAFEKLPYYEKQEIQEYAEMLCYYVNLNAGRSSLTFTPNDLIEVIGKIGLYFISLQLP